MNVRTILLASVLAGFSALLVGCGLSEEQQKQKNEADADLKALAGKWKIVNTEAAADEGDESDSVADTNYYYIIENNILRVEKGKAGAATTPTGTRKKLTLTGGKSPKQIDLVHVDEKGNDLKEPVRKDKIIGKGKKTVNKSVKELGVYKLDGDKLELATTYSTTRPGEVSDGTDRIYIKLERVKDGDTVKKEDKPSASKKDS